MCIRDSSQWEYRYSCSSTNMKNETFERAKSVGCSLIWRRMTTYTYAMNKLQRRRIVGVRGLASYPLVNNFNLLWIHSTHFTYPGGMESWADSTLSDRGKECVLHENRTHAFHHALSVLRRTPYAHGHVAGLRTMGRWRLWFGCFFRSTDIGTSISLLVSFFSDYQ